MTSTENPTTTFQPNRYHTHGRTITCSICGERHAMANDMGRGYEDMCAACLTYCEAENTHSDYGHDLGIGDYVTQEDLDTCPICHGMSEAEHSAAYWAPRTRKAPTGATVAASTVGKDGSHECGTCHVTKPVTKFPTKRVNGEQVRDLTKCRSCK